MLEAQGEPRRSALHWCMLHRYLHYTRAARSLQGGWAPCKWRATDAMQHGTGVACNTTQAGQRTCQYRANVRPDPGREIRGGTSIASPKTTPDVGRVGGQLVRALGHTSNGRESTGEGHNRLWLVMWHDFCVLDTMVGVW